MHMVSSGKESQENLFSDTVSIERSSSCATKAAMTLAVPSGGFPDTVNGQEEEFKDAGVYRHRGDQIKTFELVDISEFSYFDLILWCSAVRLHLGRAGGTNFVAYFQICF